jgi:mannose-6-phosphate isomerase
MTSALYPLRTEPVYRHYIWGGRRLGPLLGKPLGPDGTLAESWEVADEARVAQGPLAGQTLRAVDEATAGALSGDAPHYPNARIPLLIKLSDAATDLSVQIHPNDEQALRDDPDRGYPGKTEMYLILDAEPGAGVYWGLRRGATAADLERAVRRGTGVQEVINFVPVRVGDVLYTPPGVVHAIGKGIVYCEVQQNSDITYRLYDWGRVDSEGKPRPLHVEQGMAVLDSPRRTTPLVQPLALPEDGGVRRTVIGACRHFATEVLELDGPASLRRSRRTLRAVVVLDGQVTLASEGPETATCAKGQSAVIPAVLAGAEIRPAGRARVLLAYLPDLEADIAAPLRAAGYSAAEIAALGDMA